MNTLPRIIEITPLLAGLLGSDRARIRTWDRLLRRLVAYELGSPNFMGFIGRDFRYLRSFCVNGQNLTFILLYYVFIRI